MTELKRVLKNTGTCWINLGDTYASSGGESRHIGYQDPKYGNNKGGDHIEPQSPQQGIKTKSRFGIPERFYINCIDSGWIARNHIPWYKSNAMPQSVKDRFTNKWESVFFFAKEQKYYFNLDAVREKTITQSKPFNFRVKENITGHAQAKLGDKSWTATEEEMKRYNRDGTKKENPYQQYIDRRKEARKNKSWDESSGTNRKQDSTLGSDGKAKANYAGFNDRWNDSNNENKNNKGKNPGDVFFINPKPFSGSHFATFPVELPLKILKCACPSDGIVLDPFFGAGTVGVAAEMLNLRWCGIELKEEYIEIAKNRLKPYYNEKMEVFT